MISLGNYSDYRKIVINKAKVGGTDIKNYPLLFRYRADFLKNVNSGGDITNANGYDIIFKDENGNQLDHEIEKYDGNRGEFTAWVRLPTLYANKNTTIYILFGNNSITSSQENVASCWDSNYKAVHHLTDATATTVLDSTSNHVDMDKKASSQPVEKTGIVEEGQQFDGLDDTLISSSSYQSGYDGLDELTVEVWIKAIGKTGTQPDVIVAKANSYYLELMTDGSLRWRVINSSDSSFSAVTSGTDYADGKWHHVIGFFDVNDSTQLRLYVDGNQVATNSSFTGTMKSNSSKIVIGGGASSKDTFKGIIDEVRISNIKRELNYAEAVYHNIIATKNFYVVRSADAGNYSVVFRSDRSQALYISDSDQTNLDITGDITIEAWVKFKSTSAYHAIVSKWDDGISNGVSYYFRISHTTGRMTWLFRSGGSNYQLEVDKSFETDVWYHIAVVYDSSTGTAEFFVDGESVGTASDASAGAIDDGSGNFAIGAIRTLGSPNSKNYLDGYLDEVRVWNVKRTAKQIKCNRFIRVEPDIEGLVGQWSFQGNFYDSTENNNDLTKIGSPSFVADSPIKDYKYKRFAYYVYDGQTYKTNWASEVINEPSFRNVINGGPGELIIRLDRKFDSFGEDDDVKLNNSVELWVFDREQPNGVLIYKGFISGYRPVLDGNKEYVEVTVLNYVYELNYYILRDSSGNTRISYNSWDPSDILRDVIDKYRADGGTIYYTSDSIEDTNTVVSYTFQTYTIREAIDKIIELTPVGWYWFVDPNNIIHLKHRPAVAEHNFVIGSHITKIETWRRIEDLVNQVYFTGEVNEAQTGLYREYRNTGSINAYGRHAISKVDHRVSLASTADIISNRIIKEKKDPEIRTLAVITDSNGENANRGYDIESIQVGDMMKIRNIKEDVKTYSLWNKAEWDVDVWDQTLATTAADVIQIMAIEYHPNSILIEASSRQPEIAKRMEDIYRNLVQTQTVNNPDAPTSA